jgi:hypothetical protein
VIIGTFLNPTIRRRGLALKDEVAARLVDIQAKRLAPWPVVR